MKIDQQARGLPRFRYLRAAEVDQLEDLWRALHRHHVSVTTHLENMIAPVDEMESWRRRRSRYREWLSSTGSMAILAERQGEGVGYAMVTIRPESNGSWSRGERVAVVQTLSVAPEHQNTGIGTALLEELRRQLADEGITDVELAAVLDNSAAMRFYERHGFQPLSTTLVSRLSAMAGPGD